MNEPDIDRLSTEIQRKVVASKRFGSSRSIGIYHAFRSEVRTNAILTEAIKAKKKVSLPRIDDEKMRFYRFNVSKQLVKGKFGIMEPPPDDETTDLDLLIIPGVAFDKDGFRLGYGKAYYDRFLAQSPTYSIGLAFSFQLVDRLPRLDHDRKVDAIVTEREFISFRA